MRLLKLFIVIFSWLAFGCSSIGVGRPAKSDLYSDAFLKRIDAIKHSYHQGQEGKILNQLQAIADTGLLPSEKALKYNLMGIMYFFQQKYSSAIQNFMQGLPNAQQDLALESQIELNLASTSYKLGKIDISEKYLAEINYQELTANEKGKFFRLKYAMAEKAKNEDAALRYLFQYFAKYSDLNEIKKDELLPVLIERFKQLQFDEKTKFLESFPEDPLIGAHLASNEASRLITMGFRDEGKKVLTWAIDRYTKHIDIHDQMAKLMERFEVLAKINTKSIGVILPLTGKRSKFAQRILLGLDSIFNGPRGSKSEENINPTFYVRDSMGEGASGAFAMKELAIQHEVPIIIGGLFSDEATKEYLEAQKNGVLFISLSQVYLPREQKGPLLIEVPGSVESQVAFMLSDEFLGKFGKKMAIMYPKEDRGESYVKEFWELGKKKGVSIVGIQSYAIETADFREPVENLLGIKNDKAMEYGPSAQQGSMVRVKTVNPNSGFDWIFFPAFPDEALKIIPTINYYDAPVKFYVGGPSWRSRTLSKESDKRALYFIGDDESFDEQFRKHFFNTYKRVPQLMELRAIESIKLVQNIVEAVSSTSRSSFIDSLQSITSIKGLTGTWQLKDSIWIKSMLAYKFQRGEISDLNGTVH